MVSDPSCLSLLPRTDTDSSSNMLYPKEDTHNNALMFSCRSCQYSEPATAACIYRNSLQEQIAETAGNVEDVAQDPTVGDDGGDDSSALHNPTPASFMDTDAAPASDYDYGYGDDGAVPEMCTYCGKEILCPFCGQPSDSGVLLEVPDMDQPIGAEREEELVEAEKRERALSNVGFAAS